MLNNKELIRIRENNGQKVVSARELYAFLEVQTQFTKWCSRMFEYGFEEHKDYTEVTVKNDCNLQGGKSTLTDYALTLDCAKEISMLQRNEKGKEARRYFIEVEKRAVHQALRPPSRKQLAQWVVEIEEIIELQKNQLQLQAPKVAYVNQVLQSTSTYITNQIAKELGMAAVSLNKLLALLKVQYKQNDTWLLYECHQNKGYTKTKTWTYTGSDGTTKTSMQTVWTEKGRFFIHEKIKEHHNILAEKPYPLKKQPLNT